MKRHLLRLLVMAMTLLAAPVAAQAADELGLSTDGKTWSSSLTTPLFDPDMRWVPGDTETSAFWVRNQSQDRGTLEIDVLGSQVDSLLETGDLSVATRVGNGRWTSISTPGRQELSRATVAARDVQKVAVRVSFDPLSPNFSQLKDLRLNFEVRLTQFSDVAAGGAGLDGNGDGNGAKGDGDGGGLRGLLPDTGTEIGLTWALLAGVLLGGGLLLISTKNRNEDASDLR
ncbi:hypothetical protein ASD11_05995 [Aeromicrobium sp. Root495]|uniref:LPXTG cell wall anchor domain-containing protein n=1 Tax=Aeromicrobium sp. Root495 TaxID=1736550 RepID=UPI0006FF8C4E|nr:LPXTG cell wall anchor domain-containing protein [Aeromicrobium sp. Root495]KQY59141.1 hypothetical protein ASD11_05995 [Aeromicrobium sp. Root495]